ncbi:MAG: ABC transporter permease [Planctomycetales bacterium]|nr:ABC transporter permease [Planctomycetales bacterium]
MSEDAALGRSRTAPNGRPLRTVIQPKRRWSWNDVQEIWRYRSLFYFLVVRDIKVRYKQTALGAAWAILPTLATMVVLTFVFGHMLKLEDKIPSNVPYPVFVFVGLLPWNLFATSLTIAGNSLIGSSNLISKIYFPRIIIPLASMGGSLLDFTVGLVVLAVLMACYGIAPTFGIVLLPVMLVLLVMAAMTVGIGIAATTIRYRDVKQVTPFVVRIGFYLTPVIYPITIVPAEYRWVTFLNPLVGLIDGFKYCLLGESFDWRSLGVAGAMVVVGFVVSLWYFRRTEASIADLI